MMDYCFAVDKTMGKLAKWLRILGYDTIYEADGSSHWFYGLLGKDRILITRTATIHKKFAARKRVFITSDYLTEQLKQVIEDIGISLTDIRPFSRCIHCNLPTIDVSKDEVYNLVPSYIWENHDEFHMCRHCERIYWQGSHAERTHEKIAHLFKSN